MSHVGTVNYHVHKPGRQAFEIDAGGVAGNLVSPELAATEVALMDLRDGGASAGFDSDGFAFASVPTQVTNFEAENGWQDTYDRELTDLLRHEIGAKEVIVFDHTVRIDDPGAPRRPARNVH